MPKKLREELEMAAISEIMEEVRRVIIDAKAKREEFERKLREEKKAMEE